MASSQDSSAIARPDGTIARLSFGAAALYSTANAGANMVYGFANTAFPLYLASYGLPNVLVGFLAQERSFVGGFVQPVIGAWSDRLRGNPLGRRRPFFLVGVPLTAASLVVLSTRPPLWAVIAVMTVFSFFLAVAYDPYLALLPEIASAEQRGRVGGLMAVFNMVGQIGAIGLAFLLWDRNQALVFWLVALGLVIAFAVTFFGIREPPPPPRQLERGVHRSPGTYLRDLFAHRQLVTYVAATFFFWLGTGGIVPFLTRFGVDVLGVDEGVSFALVLPAILGTAVFAFPAGLLAERLGKKPVLAAGLLLYGLVALIGAQIVRSLPEALIVMAVVGLANAVATALLFPLLTDLMPRERAGELTGVGQLVWSLAQPIGAVLAGAMADATGTLRGAFAAGGLAVVVSFAVLLLVRPSDGDLAARTRSADSS